MEFRIVSAGRRALAVALLCCCLPLVPPFAASEAATEDLRFWLRGPRVSASASHIVLAPISDGTLKHWQIDPIVVWGRHFAEALTGARKAEARVVGLDFIPAVDTDAYLSFAIKEALRLDGRPEREITKLEGKLTSSPILQPDTALVGFLLQNPGFVVLSDNGQLIKPLRTVDAPISRVDLPDQRDGVVRTMLQQAGGVPYLATLLARAMGSTLSLPNAYGINYVSLKPGTAFHEVPFENLTNPSPKESALLKGACVVVGVTYGGSNDKHDGVLRKSFPGMEIHAHALATLLDGCALRRGSALQELLWVALVAGLGLGLLLLNLRFLWGLLAVLALLGAYLALAQWRFVAGSYWLPLMAPTLALLLPFGAFHLSRALAERKDRQLVERVFGQYLSPTVRDYLLAAPENRVLGGREADATVLFFDLRGSTTYAEGRAPGAVLDELNLLFSQVVPVLQRHEGTVLRYSGDGFLAIFGAPTPNSEHAVHAIAAVREIVQTLSEWNAARAAHGEFVWHFGMGLHSGNLIWGSLGSLERPELTLIGDTVNIAARLQEATKKLDVTVVMSEDTWKRAGCPEAQGPQAWETRGRREALNVYCLSLSTPKRESQP